MELELLDQLLTSDEPLRLAWLIFDVDHTPANLERARRAIQTQVKDGLLHVLYKGNEVERILELWEVRQVLADEAHWLASHAAATYFLRITEAGAKLV